MSKYMHKETGSVDTRDGWVASYDAEELAERALTGEEAFDEDEGDTLIELDETTERVIFDNGGGITLQLRGWAHWYQNEAQAARDVAEWIKSHDTNGWEGHEPAALSLEPTMDEIRNGGYRVVQITDLPAALSDPALEGWVNGRKFSESLR